MAKISEAFKQVYVRRNTDEIVFTFSCFPLDSTLVAVEARHDDVIVQSRDTVYRVRAQ